MEALAADVDSGLATLGIAREGRPFVPHVTVLRVRSPRDVARARQLLDWEPVASLGDTWVREVLLKSSDLRPGGAVHRVVGRWALAPVGEGAEPPRGTEDGSDMVKPSSPRNFVPPSGGEEPSRPGA